MTTYSAITNGQVDQDSPITQALMTALRDNPIAITEGATGAPRVRSGGLNMFCEISNIIVVGNSITYTDLGAADDILLFDGEVKVVAGGQNTTVMLRYRTSTDGGSNWGSYTDIQGATGLSETVTEKIRAKISIGNANALEFSIYFSQGGSGASGSATWMNLGVSGQT